MARLIDIDAVLRDWPYEPGVVSARLVVTDTGREVLQMRIEMGLLQMEVNGRPDGTMPGGAETYLDYLISETFQEGEAFQLTEAHCAEVDREFLQFYHRRICWLALREFNLAIWDADHTLALIYFIEKHSPDAEWVESHTRQRPFVLFHRTQAATLAALEEAGFEEAIEELNRGIAKLKRVLPKHEEEEAAEANQMILQLGDLKNWIREHFGVDRTLSERLSDAVANEQYELAAKLRDEIARRRAFKE